MRAIGQSLVCISALFMLAGCGGGESLERDSSTTGSTNNTSTGSNGTTADPVYTVTVDTLNADGQSDKDLSQGNTLTLVATVTDQDGNPKADDLITFSLSNDQLANFSNDTGTARTNDQGVAQLGLSVGDLAGDGQVTATTSGGEAGTTTFSSSGIAQVAEQPATLNLFTDKVQLPSSGSDSAQLTALVKNAQSVLMEGINVSFSAPADSGVEIQVDQNQTDASGRALATLSTRNNAQNRLVELTATVGELSQVLTVEIAGTEVTINGPRSVIIGDQVPLTLRVQDSDGVAIANQSITLSADTGSLSNTTVTSGNNGQVEVMYQGSASGVDTIRAEALNAQAQFTLTVQEDDFTFTGVPAAEIELNQSQVLTVTWNKDESPFANGQVDFTASRGTITAGASTTTDASGQASFTIESDNAGFAAITATGTDNNGDEVTAQLQIEFIATVPDSVLVDATPDIVGPDGQTSTITAIVRDAAGNLVKNAVISFNVDDTSTGSIAPSQATTDSNGVASTVFTSGAVSSEDAVVVTAQYVEDPAAQGSVVLTVGNRAFDISIGTGNKLQTPDNSTYLKEFTAFVTDSAGRPIEGEELTVSATPIKWANDGEYRRGYWEWDTGRSVWFSVTTDVCSNEDIDADGILDKGEDANNDLMLTPGIVGSISFKNGPVTDINGQVIIEYRYPVEYAAFADIELSVFTRSTGSEAFAYTRFTLPALADDLANEAARPPNSPFGAGPNPYGFAEGNPCTGEI